MIIMSRTLKVTGNHVMYDHSASFLRVIMPWQFVLLAVSEEAKHDLFCSIYSKTIIRFWISQKPHPMIVY